MYFANNNPSHLPFFYVAVANPAKSMIFVYSHGSGSTLNNVYNFVANLYQTYNIAILAYDYTGDGESTLPFHDYNNDIKTILSFVVSQGYDLRRVILAGFSLGSYSTLCLEGMMPRLLISPITGIISYVEKEPARF